MFLLKNAIEKWSARRLAMLAAVSVLVIAGSGYWVWDWYRLDKKYRDAQEALARHQLIQAKILFEECAQARPRDAEVWFFLARTLRRLDAEGDANRFLTQAEQIGGLTEIVHLERQLLQFQLGRGKEHERTLWNLVENNHPDAATILEALCKGYRRQFSLTQALHCCKLIVEEFPDHLPGWILRGQVLEQLQFAGDAVPCYEKALDMAPDHTPMRLRVARLLLDQNNPRAALQHLEQLPPSQRTVPPANLFFVQAHLQQGHTDEARDLLQQTGLDLRKDALAAYLQGQSHLLEARHALAEEWFRMALALGPGAARPMHGLIQCLNVLGKKEEAAQWVAKVDGLVLRRERAKALTQEIIAHPERPQPRCQLGDLTLNELKNEQDGLAWLHSALELDPQDARAHTLLAHYYRRQGNLAMADFHERGLKK